jgi:hypothetical protein
LKKGSDAKEPEYFRQLEQLWRVVRKPSGLGPSCLSTQVSPPWPPPPEQPSRCQRTQSFSNYTADRFLSLGESIASLVAPERSSNVTHFLSVAEPESALEVIAIS